MDQSYVYEEAEYEEGLTFKKIGYFLAKGWIRMVAYAGILLALAAVIFLPIKRYYKAEGVAQASIEYIYDGIDKGKDPAGGDLKTDNIISSPVLAKAVESAGLGEIIKDTTALRGKLRVESVLPVEYVDLQQSAKDGNQDAQKKLLTYDLHPSRYNIVLSEPSGLGISDSQATLLMDKIVEAYFDDFKSRYTVKDMLAADIYGLSADERVEFSDLYDSYTAALDVAKKAVNKLGSKDSAFISAKTGASFATLNGKLAEIKLELDRFKKYVRNNYAWRDVTDAVKTFDMRAAELGALEVAQTAYIDSLQAQIDLIKPDKTLTPSSNGVIETDTYPAWYKEYQDLLENAIAERKDISMRKAENAARIAAVAGPPTRSEAEQQPYIDEAVALAAAVEEKCKDFVQMFNGTVNDYYDVTVVSNSVRLVQPAVVTNKSIGLSLVLIFFIAVVIGVLAGGIVTGVKIARANAAKKKGAEAAEASDTAKPEEPAEQNKD